MMSLYPSEGAAIVVLTNIDEPLDHRLFTVGIAQDLAAAVLPRYAAALEAERAAVNGSSPSRPASMNPTLVGEWSGQVALSHGESRLALTVSGEGQVTVRLDDGAVVNVRGVAAGATQLTGRFDGPASLAGGNGPAELILNVRLREGRLRGELTVQSAGARPHFALSSFLSLERDSPAALNPVPAAPPRWR